MFMSPRPLAKDLYSVAKSMPPLFYSRSKVSVVLSTNSSIADISYVFDILFFFPSFWIKKTDYLHGCFLCTKPQSHSVSICLNSETRPMEQSTGHVCSAIYYQMHGNSYRIDGAQWVDLRLEFCTYRCIPVTTLGWLHQGGKLQYHVRIYCWQLILDRGVLQAG